MTTIRTKNDIFVTRKNASRFIRVFQIRFCLAVVSVLRWDKRMVSRLGRLNPSRSVLLLCDLQEKFAKNIKHFDAIVETSGKVADVARVLSVPSIITEQYPKGGSLFARFWLLYLGYDMNMNVRVVAGLGHTVPQLKVKAPDAHVFHKTMFSMCSEQLIHHIQEKSPGILLSQLFLISYY